MRSSAARQALQQNWSARTMVATFPRDISNPDSTPSSVLDQQLRLQEGGQSGGYGAIRAHECARFADLLPARFAFHSRKLLVQGPPLDAENLSSLRLIAAGLLEHLHDLLALNGVKFCDLLL